MYSDDEQEQWGKTNMSYKGKGMSSDQKYNKYGSDASMRAPRPMSEGKGHQGSEPRHEPGRDSEQNRASNDVQPGFPPMGHKFGFAGYDASYENTPGKDQDKAYGEHFKKVVEAHGHSHDEHFEGGEPHRVEAVKNEKVEGA